MTRAAPRLPRMTTTALMNRLERHYLGTEMFAGGDLATEVGMNNGSNGNASRCDAVFIGYTSTWGRIMVGHEVKTSRADWRHEMDQPFKAGWWADACHAWYIVAPDTSIVEKHELPDGWGLLVADPRKPSKLQKVVGARVKQDHNPPWDAVRSVTARLNTLRGREIERLTRRRLEVKVKEAVQLHDPMRDSRGDAVELTTQQANDLEVMELFRRRGITLGRGRRVDDGIWPEHLADPKVRELLRDGADAERLRAVLTDRYVTLPNMRTQVDALVAAVEKLKRA